jgi:hypothetical protein
MYNLDIIPTALTHDQSKEHQTNVINMVHTQMYRMCHDTGIGRPAGCTAGIQAMIEEPESPPYTPTSPSYGTDSSEEEEEEKDTEKPEVDPNAEK